MTTRLNYRDSQGATERHDSELYARTRLNETDSKIGVNVQFTSLLLLVFGLLCTIVAVPHDPTPAGALFLPGLFLASGICAGPLLHAFSCGWTHLFRVECLMHAGLVYWLLLDLIQGLYPIPMERTYVYSGFIAIGLFTASMILGTGLPTLPLPTPVQKLAAMPIKAEGAFRMLIICFLLGIFWFALSTGFSISKMIDGLDQPRFLAPWSPRALGGWERFPQHLKYFGFLVPSLVVIVYLSTRRLFDYRVLIGISLMLMLLPFFMQTGSRRDVGGICAAALLTLIWGSRYISKTNALIIVAILCIALIAMMNYMLIVRSAGISGTDTHAIEPTDLIKEVRVDDNFFRLCQTIRLIPESYSHTGWQYVLYVAVRPIPRVFWRGKPTSSGFDLAKAVKRKGVAYSVSAIGEWYMAFGWIGIAAIGILMGWLAANWSQLLLAPPTPMRGITYAWGSMAIFIGLRSSLDLVLVSYVVLALIGVRELWALVRRKQ